MVLLKDRQIDQWNKSVSPEIDQHILGNLIYGKADIADDWKKIGCQINSSRTIDRMKKISP